MANIGLGRPLKGVLLSACLVLGDVSDAAKVPHYVNTGCSAPGDQDLVQVDSTVR